MHLLMGTLTNPIPPTHTYTLHILTLNTLHPPHQLPGNQMDGYTQIQGTNAFTFLIKTSFYFVANNMETGKWLEILSIALA
jgi:hypothetical protein